MYLPRSLISQLYAQLIKTHHPLSPPVLVLVALEPDALCACRMLTSMLKRDYVPHKIQPINGYTDLANAGQTLVRPMRFGDGGSGGLVVCLGVGGLVDLENVLGLEVEDDGSGGFDGVQIWVLDERRPWNLSNVFGGASVGNLNASEDGQIQRQPGVERGQISKGYKSQKGGIIVFDDGDIEEELAPEREAWYALDEMPEVDDNEEEDLDSSDSEGESEHESTQASPGQKRKSWSDAEDDVSESEKENRPRQKRRSNSSTPIASSESTPRKNRSRLQTLSNIHSTPPSNQQSSLPQAVKEPSARTLRKRLLRMRRKHTDTLRAYHSLGTSYSEPISSLMYSLASDLGREDNDLLWLAIIGVSSTELYGRTPTGLSVTNYDLAPQFTSWHASRGARIRQAMRDEVRRLNPPELTESGYEVARGHAEDIITTRARSPTDTSIRLSPEPRFLLIRHWSLYDSMLHSPYLAAKLHVWSDNGRRRLHKLLAKMGVSLSQCRQSYTHMDVELKKDLRKKLLTFAPIYGLDGLIPPPPAVNNRGGAGDGKDGWGFVRCWGWKACLSAADISTIVGAILEVGGPQIASALASNNPTPTGAAATSDTLTVAEDDNDTTTRFYAAYDALLSPTQLLTSIPLAQHLARAILRTGTSLLQKRQIRHLRAFRMALVKEGPDTVLFTHPGALMKLALWLAQAVGEVDKHDDDDGEEDASKKSKSRKRGKTPLVLGCADDARDVYVVVGLGGGGVSATSEQDAKKRAEKKEEREKRRKEREEKREQKRREREERMAANGDDPDEADDETEEEDSESDSDESSSDEEDEENERRNRKMGEGRNRFGNAFQEVVEETNARVRLDSFEHCVVEVRKEDLGGFLEGLSMKAVVG